MSSDDQGRLGAEEELQQYYGSGYVVPAINATGQLAAAQPYPNEYLGHNMQHGQQQAHPAQGLAAHTDINLWHTQVYDPITFAAYDEHLVQYTRGADSATDYATYGSNSAQNYYNGAPMAYPSQQSCHMLDMSVPLIPFPDGVTSTSGLGISIDQPHLQLESPQMNPLPRPIVGSQKTKQMAHKRRHDDTPIKYTCEYCGEGFTKRHNYLGHKNAHEGKRPYQYCPSNYLAHHRWLTPASLAQTLTVQPSEQAPHATRSLQGETMLMMQIKMQPKVRQVQVQPSAEEPVPTGTAAVPACTDVPEAAVEEDEMTTDHIHIADDEHIKPFGLDADIAESVEVSAKDEDKSAEKPADAESEDK